MPLALRGRRRMDSVLRALVVAGMTGLLAVPAAALTVRERQVVVMGEGTVMVAPDRAILRGGVSTQARTAREAAEANAKAMQAVLAALRALGIAERDLQTAQFTIQPVREAAPGAQRVTGFQALNQVSVTLREVGRLAEVLDRMIEAGANTVTGVQFVVAEPSRLLDEARAAAVEDARRRAEVLAKAAGVRLGRAIAITEGEGASVPVVMRSAAGVPAPPMAIGEETLRVSVSVTFELLH